MVTLEPVLGALIPTGWGKGGGLSFLYDGIYFSGSNHYTSTGILVRTSVILNLNFSYTCALPCL